MADRRPRVSLNVTPIGVTPFLSVNVTMGWRGPDADVRISVPRLRIGDEPPNRDHCHAWRRTYSRIDVFARAYRLSRSRLQKAFKDANSFCPKTVTIRYKNDPPPHSEISWGRMNLCIGQYDILDMHVFVGWAQL